MEKIGYGTAALATLKKVGDVKIIFYHNSRTFEVRIWFVLGFRKTRIDDDVEPR